MNLPNRWQWPEHGRTGKSILLWNTAGNPSAEACKQALHLQHVLGGQITWQEDAAHQPGTSQATTLPGTEMGEHKRAPQADLHQWNFARTEGSEYKYILVCLSIPSAGELHTGAPRSWWFVIFRNLSLLPLLSLTFHTCFHQKFSLHQETNRGNTDLLAKEIYSLKKKWALVTDPLMTKTVHYWNPTGFLSWENNSSQFWVPAPSFFGCLCHISPQEIAMFFIPVFWHVQEPTQWHTLIQMSLHSISVNRI